jgi:hemoglobin
MGMKSAHTGMVITNAELEALVGDLVTALKQSKVGEREQFELLSVVSPMRQDIVERR